MSDYCMVPVKSKIIRQTVAAGFVFLDLAAKGIFSLTVNGSLIFLDV